MSEALTLKRKGEGLQAKREGVDEEVLHDPNERVTNGKRIDNDALSGKDLRGSSSIEEQENRGGGGSEGREGESQVVP